MIRGVKVIQKTQFRKVFSQKRERKLNNFY